MKLDERQLLALEMIRDFRKDHSGGPLLSEIADGMGITRQYVHKMILVMEARGLVDRGDPVLKQRGRLLDLTKDGYAAIR